MKRLLSAYGFPGAARARAQVAEWFRRPLGQSVQETERRLLEQVLANLFGYQLVQVGRPAEADLLASTRVRDRAILLRPGDAPLAPSRQADVGMAAEDALPIASDSVDVVVLPHVLEYAAAPHQVLREAERVLIPEGRLVILGFNPWSLWGLMRILPGRRARAPWCGTFYSPTRIRDWLALLGFDIVLVRGFLFRPPLQHPGIMTRLSALERWGARWWSPFGGGYLLVAKKRVSTLTPIRPRWRPRSALLPGRLAKPTLRKQEHE